jgi:carbonic anhydrase
MQGNHRSWTLPAFVVLALALSGCQTFKNRMEQKDAAPTTAPKEAALPHEKAAPAPEEGSIESRAKETPSADKMKKGEAKADATPEVKLIDAKGKVVQAPQEASVKNGKEITKVEVPKEESAQALAAVKDSSAKVSTEEAAAASVETARHPGPVPAEKAFGWLKNGNTRFVKGYLRKDGESAKDRKRLVAGQHPHAVILTCGDSRVPPELIFDQKLGEIYTLRVAGNVLANNSVAGVEYAVQYLGSNLVVLLGHDNCDASEASVKQTLLDKSKILSDAVASNTVKVERGFYHLDSGAVDWQE